MNPIYLPEAPGIEGLRKVIGEVKARTNPDPWAQQDPIIIQGTSRALRLALLIRLNKVPNVYFQEV